MVWSSPIGTARSSSAKTRCSGGRNRAREIRASASRTRGSLTPWARTCRAIAAPGEGSGGLGPGMFARLFELEVLDLELHLAPAVPLVDRRVEGERAGRVRLQRL